MTPPRTPTSALSRPAVPAVPAVPAGPDGPAMPATLSRAAARVAPALRESIASLHPSLREVASYHFGWTDEHGRPTASNGGKSLRAALALLSARAAGASEQVGVPAAVAVQLVHEFSLLHDDVMDGDVTRRHRPTAWSVFGAGLAILTGDGLLARAIRVLTDASPVHGDHAARVLDQATEELITGQAADLAQERRADVTLADCLRMVEGKTGALLACAATLGAVLAGGSAGLLAALGDYGRTLGVAFQLADDLLGIWGDPESTGKPVYADLRAHKRTVPVVAALHSGGPAARELAGLLAGSDMTADEDLVLAVKLIEEAGGRSWAAAEAGRLARAAVSRLDGLGLPGDVHTELRDLAGFTVLREV